MICIGKQNKIFGVLYILIDAVFAGVMIAIGTAVYLNCTSKIVGAFLFSIGLITINEFGFGLYTGKVGYARKIKDIPMLLVILIGNTIGCLLASVFPTTGAEEIITAKLAQPYVETFIRALVCGILIYICVATKKDKPWITLIAVPTFILCGAEHSIADICFMFAASEVSWQALVFILVVITGNAVGALLISFWVDTKKDLKT